MPRKKDKKTTNVYTVPPEQWCRRQKADGSMCQAAKKTGMDSCVAHFDAPVFDGSLTQDEFGAPRKMQTYDEVVNVIEWTAHKVNTEVLDPHAGKAVASLAMAAIKAIEMRDKGKEKGGALNGRDALEAIAKGLTGALAREVLLSRNFDLLKDPGALLQIEAQSTNRVQELVLEMEQLEGKDESDSNEMDRQTIFWNKQPRPEPIPASYRSPEEGAGAIGDLFE